jgi:hypothetical protein
MKTGTQTDTPKRETTSVAPKISPQSSTKVVPKMTPQSQRPGGIDPNYRGIPMTPMKDNPLRGPVISNAEGLDRAYETDNNTYGYGDTLFIAGTKGSIVGKDWRQNIQYIGIPWLQGLFYDNLDKVQAAATMVAPELAPELALARGTFEVGKTQAGPGVKDDMKVKVYETDRYKEAEKALKANPNIKRVVGHSLGGAVALELQKNYPYLKGEVYGTPYSDVLGKERAKDFLNEERETRNARYGDQWYNQPAKFVDNKAQDLVEKVTGMDQVKGVKETGIQRFRQAGDPISILDNSAQTSMPSNLLKAHDYHDIAQDHFAVNPSNAYGYVTPDGKTALFQ